MSKRNSFVFFITSVLVTFLSGLIAGYFLFNSKPITKEIIKTKTIYGEPIKHDNITYKNEKLSFESEYKGAGKSETEIDLSFIPEISNHHVFTLGAGLMYGEAKFGASAGYMYRFKTISVGPEIIITNKTFGIFLKSSIML